MYSSVLKENKNFRNIICEKKTIHELKNQMTVKCVGTRLHFDIYTAD